MAQITITMLLSNINTMNLLMEILISMLILIEQIWIGFLEQQLDRLHLIITIFLKWNTLINIFSVLLLMRPKVGYSTIE